MSKRLARCTECDAVESESIVGKVVRSRRARCIENKVIPVDRNLSWRPATRAIPSIGWSTSPCESGRLPRRQHESHTYAAQHGEEGRGRAGLPNQPAKSLKASGEKGAGFDFPVNIVGNTMVHSEDSNGGMISCHCAGL